MESSEGVWVCGFVGVWWDMGTKRHWGIWYRPPGRHRARSPSPAISIIVAMNIIAIKRTVFLGDDLAALVVVCRGHEQGVEELAPAVERRRLLHHLLLLRQLSLLVGVPAEDEGRAVLEGDPRGVLAVAGLSADAHDARLVAVPGVDDLDVDEAGAQAEALEVVLGHGEEVVVVRAVAVPVEVGPVVAALPVGQRVPAEIVSLRARWRQSEGERVVIERVVIERVSAARPPPPGRG